MVLYIDIAILGGFLLNFLYLDTAASVIGVRIKKRRIVTGSVILSSLTVISLFLPWIKVLYLFIYIYALRLIFGKCTFPELLRRTGICLCVCFLYGGIILAVIPPHRIYTVAVNGGGFFVAEDLWFYLPLGGVYALTKVIMFFVSRSKKLYPVRIQIEGQAVVTKAMIDTGNSLRIPERGNPVIIAERSLFGEIKAEPEIIPFRSIGEERRFTEVYPIERLCLLEEKQVYENVYAAFTTKQLSPCGAYRALLHNSFLERK